MTRTYPLLDDYVAREVSTDEFTPVFEALFPRVFGDIVELPWRRMLSDDARAARETLRGRLGEPLRVHWLIHHDDEVVGWTTGIQQTSERYGMSNSAVLPAHRGRGVYAAMIRALLERLRGAGFQVVVSHHHATNGAVLVPKLKAGFVISGMEVSDLYGLLVNLSYFFDPRRREAFEFRVGNRHVTGEVARALGYTATDA